ncbi:MAG: bifunctional GTP diphosphokinase/guanosine-3',5'-bis pyrophosphate 3'-pyrophosphohydrolase [Gammaproteobacteria bacterium]
MAAKLQPNTHQESRFLISDLCALLESYMDPEHIREIYRAYLFGAEAHDGQHRLTGEPYIYHPLQVARILVGMGLDHYSVIAAILHDVIEDTATAKEQVAQEFGDEVAELVDGVSKLTKIQFENKAEAQAENFRKMVLAMVRDIRVILIKLADRLHNMRTLGAMPAQKRRSIARETLEIYAPIAMRLGMNTLRLELEDLGFATLYPMRYRVLTTAIKKSKGNRREILSKIERAISQRTEHEGIDCRITSREKHAYSLYRKMQTKGVSLSEVFDVYAFRMVVDKVDTCYRALGVTHSLYKPMPGHFKDYIAIPKSNGYQSLHTVLFGPHGVPIEVQIRSQDMDRVAESGIAAHWLYKSGDSDGNRAQTQAREWLRGLLEMQKFAGNSLEFLENVKIDLFPNEVYVFTPKGTIMELPRGATAVDFAYAVHTDVGNTCIATKINRHLAPLRTPLLNGQTVEIITAPGAHPNSTWLNFIVTGKARSNIRHYLKNLRKEEAIELGRRMLDKVLTAYNLSTDKLPKRRLKTLLKECHLATKEDLLEDIGLGNRVALLVARRLMPENDVATNSQGPAKSADSRTLSIKGTEGMVVTLAKCCHPVPGDPVVGFVSTGRGFVIHTRHCKNVADSQERMEKCIDVGWETDITSMFPVEIRIGVTNQRGVLATVAAAIADTGSNIENVAMDERDGLDSTMIFIITVKDRRHLARVMRNLRIIPQVFNISRSKS